MGRRAGYTWDGGVVGGVTSKDWLSETTEVWRASKRGSEGQPIEARLGVAPVSFQADRDEI